MMVKYMVKRSYTFLLFLVYELLLDESDVGLKERWKRFKKMDDDKCA